MFARTLTGPVDFTAFGEEFFDILTVKVRRGRREGGREGGREGEPEGVNGSSFSSGAPLSRPGTKRSAG
jgi:hypothetical protein